MCKTFDFRAVDFINLLFQSGDGDDRSELLDVSPLIQKPTTLQTKFGTASILLSVVAVIVGFVISYLFSTQK